MKNRVGVAYVGGGGFWQVGVDVYVPKKKILEHYHNSIGGPPLNMFCTKNYLITMQLLQ